MPLPEDFPFTAIYSQRDGIADWRACIDPAGQAREVRTSHSGMALDPVVIDIVTETLSQIHNQPLERRVVAGLRADAAPRRLSPRSGRVTAARGRPRPARAELVAPGRVGPRRG